MIHSWKALQIIMIYNGAQSSGYTGGVGVRASFSSPPPRGLTILLEVSSFDQCSMNTTDFIIKPGNKAQETQMIGDMFRKERDSQLYFLVSNSIFQCKQLKIKPGKTADGLEE